MKRWFHERQRESKDEGMVGLGTGDRELDSYRFAEIEKFSVSCQELTLLQSPFI